MLAMVRNCVIAGENSKALDLANLIFLQNMENKWPLGNYSDYLTSKFCPIFFNSFCNTAKKEGKPEREVVWRN